MYSLLPELWVCPLPGPRLQSLKHLKQPKERLVGSLKRGALQRAVGLQTCVAVRLADDKQGCIRQYTLACKSKYGCSVVGVAHLKACRSIRDGCWVPVKGPSNWRWPCLCRSGCKIVLRAIGQVLALRAHCVHGIPIVLPQMLRHSQRSGGTGRGPTPTCVQGGGRGGITPQCIRPPPPL